LEADLYEELARLEGYDKVPETVPATGTVGGRLPEHSARQALRRVLSGAGWSEVLTFPFLGQDDVQALGLPPDDRRRRPIALVNPLSKEESVLRTSLLPGLARVLRHNVNRQTHDVAVFEIGRVFLPPTPEDPGSDAGPEGGVLPAEPIALGLLACGAFGQGRWDSPARPVDVADLMGAIDAARRAVGRGPLVVTPTDERPFHPGRAARLTIEGTDVGVAGELHPRVVSALDLPPRTLAAELRLDFLLAEGIRSPQPITPSSLPSLRLDVAVLVAAEVSAGQVEEAVRAGAGQHLTTCTLFDVFQGDQIGTGLKNLAYHLRLDDPDHQLTDADAHTVIESIAAAVSERLGGTLRR
jgi:phenylalanyl-tRNA synthetase beta chain